MLVRKVCRVWSTHHTAEVPSVTMAESIEQRIFIRFRQKLGYTKRQKVYGDQCMSRTWVYEWSKRFQDGHQNVVSDAGSGKPANGRIDEKFADVPAVVQKDCWISVCELSEDVDVSYDSVHSILYKDLCMRRVSAKIVPKTAFSWPKGKSGFSGIAVYFESWDCSVISRMWT